MSADGASACAPPPSGRGFRLLVAAVAALGLAVFLAHGAALLAFPAQYDYGEGGAMIASLRLARGEALYPDPSQPPYVVNPYPPVFLAAGALFMGDGPTLFGGRLVALASALGVALLLAAWLRRQAGWEAALAGGAAFLIHPLVLGWAPLYRPDLPALLLGLAGLGAVQAGTRRGDGLGALLLVLALYTKQSMVACLAAAVIALAVQDRRRAGRFVLAVAALGALAAVALEIATGGRFLQQCVAFNLLPWEAERTAWLLGPYALSSLGLMGLAILGRSPRQALPGLVLLCALPLALGSGRVGGFYNYFLELHLALCALGGLAVATLRRAGPGPARVGGALLMAQLLGFGALSALPPYLVPPADHLRRETLPVLAGQVPPWAQGASSLDTLAVWLARHPGPILAENLANPTLAGRTPWVVDPLVLFSLARSGRWDPEPVLRRVDRREFALILLSRLEDDARFPAAVVARLRAAYQPAARVGPDILLLPRPAGPP